MDIMNDIKDEVKATSRAKSSAKPSSEKGLVEIRVPRGEIGDENLLIVGDNGKYYKLKRGAVVKVPQSVADIIENSEERKEKARELIEKLMN